MVIATRLAHHPVVVSAAARSVATIFFANGFMFANWVVRIPAVKEDLALGEGALGVALLFMAIGGILAMQLGGALTARIGSAPVAVVSGALYCLAFPTLGLAPSVVWLALGLALVGLGNGAMDVSMNAQADAVERHEGRRVMSFSHAMFSLGLALGTIPAGAFAAARVEPAVHFALVGVPMALLVLSRARTLVRDVEASAAGPSFALPRGPLLLLGLICLCGAVVEGAMNDWIAVYVEHALGFGAVAAAVAFGAFSSAMLIGRLAGDVVTDRLGDVGAVRYGLVLAALGVALSATGVPALFTLGFALVGLGIAGIFPSVFRAAGRVPGRPRGPSMAAAVTLGYAGFLAGPPAIGFLAEATSLRVALCLLIPLCLAGAALAGVMRVAR